MIKVNEELKYAKLNIEMEKAHLQIKLLNPEDFLYERRKLVDDFFRKSC